MPMTYQAANTYLNNLARGSSVSSFTPYIGLSTTPPNRSGGNITEPPAAFGYARVKLSSQVESALDGVIQNGSVIYFPEATSNWGTCTHYVIYTAAAGGSVMAYGALDNPITPEAGKLSFIPAQGLRLGLE